MLTPFHSRLECESVVAMVWPKASEPSNFPSQTLVVVELVRDIPRYTPVSYLHVCSTLRLPVKANVVTSGTDDKRYVELRAVHAERNKPLLGTCAFEKAWAGLAEHRAPRHCATAEMSASCLIGPCRLWKVFMAMLQMRWKKPC